jgi:hypothetical protein
MTDLQRALNAEEVLRKVRTSLHAAHVCAGILGHRVIFDAIGAALALIPAPAAEPLTGEAYWNLMQNTADRVSKWPDWKTGSVSSRRKDCGCRMGDCCDKCGVTAPAPKERP